MPDPSSLAPFWLATGMGGVLGWGASRRRPAEALVLAARRRMPWWRHDPSVRLELSTVGALARLVQELRPAVVIHAACLARVADCVRDPAATERINVAAVAELMAAAETVGSFVVYVSTEQVFAGTAARYLEQDAPDSQDPYGASKARAEHHVLAAGGAVVRLPLLLGPRVTPTRAGADGALIEAVRQGQRPRLFTDEWRCPVAADVAAEGLWQVARRRRGGAFHLAGAEAISRYELGLAVLEAHGVAAPRTHLQATSVAEFDGPPRQPRLILDCRRAIEVLDWQPEDLRQSLARFAGLPVCHD